MTGALPVGTEANAEAADREEGDDADGVHMSGAIPVDDQAPEGEDEAEE